MDLGLTVIFKIKKNLCAAMLDGITVALKTARCKLEDETEV